MSAQPSEVSVLEFITPRWRRCLAGLIDWVILLIVAGELVSTVRRTVREYRSDYSYELHDLEGVLYTMVLFVVYFAYECGSRITLGSTLGKKLFGLAIVTAQGASLSGKLLLRRALIELIFAALSLCVLVYFYCVFFFVYDGGQNVFSSGYFENQLAIDLQKITIEMIAMSFIPVWILVNLVLFIFSRYRRSLHDRIAGTFVINERKRRKQQRS